MSDTEAQNVIRDIQALLFRWGVGIIASIALVAFAAGVWVTNLLSRVTKLEATIATLELVVISKRDRFTAHHYKIGLEYYQSNGHWPEFWEILKIESERNP